MLLCRVLAVLLTGLPQHQKACSDLGSLCSSGKSVHVSTSCAAGTSSEAFTECEQSQTHVQSNTVLQESG